MVRPPGRWHGVAVLLVVVAAVEPARPAGAQQLPDRPRTALVLSGGGARGAAHIGVLQVLEKARVPVDLVVGTSMGAVVGGLWASGMPAAELEREILAVDWPAVFRDEVPRARLAFRRKEEQHRLLLQPELGISLDGVQLPTGLVAGHRLELLLETLLAPVLAEHDFDHLPIPFRATAADLETGEIVVLETGDLARAIRASMAVPAAFTPVERQGRLLVDGGVTDNLPVDVARDLGAEMVIAVDVGSAPMQVNELTSALSIASQITRLMVRGNTDRVLDRTPPDVLVTPDLTGLASTDFPQSAIMIERGEEAAEEIEEALRPLTVPEDQYREWRNELEARRLARTRPTHLRVTGPDPEERVRLADRLGHHVGVPLDAERLRRDLDRVYGLGRYERVGFGLERRGEDLVLVIDAVPKEIGLTTLRFGLALADDFGGRGRFTLAAQLLRQDLTRQGGELRLAAALGEDRRLRVDLYQPITVGSPVFVQADASHRRHAVFRTINADRVEYTDRRTALRLGFGSHLGTAARTAAGVTMDHVDAGVSGADATSVGFQGWERSLMFDLELDTFDDASLPGSGVVGRVRLVSSSPVEDTSDRHDRVSGQATWVFRLGRQTAAVGIAAGMPIRGAIPYHDRYTLGGFLRLTGLPPASVVGEEMILGRLALFRDFGPAGVARIGVLFEAGDARPQGVRLALDQLRPSLTGIFSLRTVWGTGHAALGLAEGGAWAFYLFLGNIPW